MSRRRLAIALCLLIAGLDAAQPLFWPWVPKHAGAIAGAVLYAGFAAGLALGRPFARWAVGAMPVIPLAVLGLHAAGVALPVTPDGAMLGILGLQLAASAAALSTGHSPDGDPPREGVQSRGGG